MLEPSISVVIATYNEGTEVRKTVDSVIANTRNLREVIVVDDGSDDGSCDSIATEPVRVIRHEDRLGVAPSRDEGSRAAQGDVLCYLDAHQRVSRDCLDLCARVAVERSAITCPDVRNFGLFGWRLHGAEFRLCPERGFFTGQWRQWWPTRRVSQVTGLRSPPYLVPRALYPCIAWSQSLRGWGASEASVVLKAFFLNLAIYHIWGPLARHQFRRRFPYETTWDGIWRNHAIIARICFDDATWQRHWLPRVFEPHLSSDALADVNSAEVLAEHEAFLRHKRRPDSHFWTELLRQPPPDGVR